MINIFIITNMTNNFHCHINQLELRFSILFMNIGKY